MNRVLNKIENILLSSTLWIFITGILFTSIVMCIQLEQQNWGTYISFIGKLSLLYSPVLLFAYFRNTLQIKLPNWGMILLWAVVFIALPVFFNLIDAHLFLIDGELGIAALELTSIAFLCTEIAIQANKIWEQKQFGVDWLSRINLEYAIFFLMFCFSIFYIWIGYASGVPELQGTTIWIAISYVFQLFIILLLYYGFYWVNHYFLITRIWKKKGLIYYIFSFIATLIIFFPIITQLIYYLPINHSTQIHPVNNGQIFESENWMVPFFGMVLSIPFVLTIRWFQQMKTAEELAKEKSQTELSLLKQQINPHFFFNTLNNLYALSITQDEQTPEVILQLSELMRYTIYKGKEEQVSLKEEIEYIEKYVQLQQIRLHKKLDFKFYKQVNNEAQNIPPLLFINLVENAFKHGIEPAEEDCFLHLTLKSNENGLELICENSVEDKNESTPGTGLKNLKRRLELLYPNNHQLDFEETKKSYKAKLKINY